MYVNTTMRHRRTTFFLLFIRVVCTQASTRCTFPDKKWITTSVDDIRYGEDSCKWRCGGGRTGRGCADACTEHPSTGCGIGMRQRNCKPPLDALCLICGQNGDEARQGGYSFNMGSRNNNNYELLQLMGSFEYSKIYPAAGMFSRNAVYTNRSTSDVGWADVLFSSIYQEWSGVGKIDLHYTSVGLGAMHSSVFLLLTAPYAKLKVCGVPTKYFGSFKPVNKIKGLVYEFQYRQRLKFTNTIEVKASLIAPYSTDETIRSIITIPSTDKWTRTQQLFDYANLGSREIAEYSCFQLEFEMQGHNELLFDELRVFVNLIENSQFSITGSWSTFPIGTSEDPWNEWGDAGYVVLKGGRHIQQMFTLYEFDIWHSVIAATFSMKVRGHGHLVVKYTLNRNEEHEGQEATKEHSEILVFMSISPDDTEGSSEWQILNIPLTLHVEYPDRDVQTIMVINRANATDTEALEIDDVFLYVDDRRCPVLRCDDDTKYVFVNGRCEVCTLENGDTCNTGTKQIGCTMDLNSMVPKCDDCPVVKEYNPQGITADRSPGDFVYSSNECTFKCTAGWWFLREGVDNSGPVCKQCTHIRDLSCRVGWYAVDCMDEADATCLPCDILDQYDESVVYVTSNYNKSVYHEPVSIQCKHACTPGQYQYGARANSGIPLCFPCTQSICGAKDTGLSTSRTINGLQYTSRCTALQDSQCYLCKSNDMAVLFTENGQEAGDWCQYECAAGSMPCGTCTWDSSHTEVFRNATHFRTYGIDTGTRAPTGNITFSQQLMVRFTGSVTISTAQFDTWMAINVYITTQHPYTRWDPPNDTGVVLRLFPVVPPSALATMQKGDNISVIINAPVQQFDVTIEMRDFINTESFQVWNAANIRAGVSVFLVYELIVSTGDYHDVTLEGDTSISGGIDVNDFVVQKQTSVKGCCALGNLMNLHEEEYERLTRCAPCNHAVGISGNHTNPLPANAHWDTPNSCGWACNSQHELLPGGDGQTCEYCMEQTCNIGHYWDICDTCVECAPPATHSNFTGAGTIRYDRNSCPVKCDEGFYYDGQNNVCELCTPSAVLNCSTQLDGTFFEYQCSDFDDAMCVRCTVCALGSNASIPCGIHHDSTCIPCDESFMTMPDLTPSGGAEWRLGVAYNDYCKWDCIDGYMYNPLDKACVKCHGTFCTIGYYRVPCTQENNFTGCARCETPANAIVISSGHESSPYSCVWECPEEMEYNSTISLCVLIPIVIPLGIIIPTIPELCSSVADKSRCDWGSFPDTSLLTPSTPEIPCAELCTACLPAPPGQVASTVYLQKGSCEWACATPLMWNGSHCMHI